MSKFIIVKCPTCGKLVTWNKKNAFRPFCSEYCQLIDFSEWTSGEKRIRSIDDSGEN